MRVEDNKIVEEEGIKKDENKISNINNNSNKNNNDDVKNKITRYMIFTVKDNGRGIPKDKVGNLFKKFYQIDTSATRKHSGTGLGLVICKGIVEAHGGKIWVDKNHKNGFSIKFTLPIIDPKR